MITTKMGTTKAKIAQKEHDVTILLFEALVTNVYLHDMEIFLNL